MTIQSKLHRAAAWLASLLSEPDGTKVSSARVGALLCVVTACGIAIGGLALNRDQSGSIAALLGGGAANLFARTRSTPKGGDQ
ncbi:MAG TPA: hypothetical protein VFZ98_00055 [Vicinamibacterales bacterium]